MTGSQEHPGSGYTIWGDKAHKVDLIELGRDLGIENLRKVNPWNLKETEEVVKEELEKDSSSLAGKMGRKTGGGWYT